MDVNLFHRKFVSEVRRCDEMERKLRYIEAEVLKDRVAIPESNVNPLAPNPREIIDLEVWDNFYLEMLCWTKAVLLWGWDTYLKLSGRPRVKTSTHCLQTPERSLIKNLHIWD